MLHIHWGKTLDAFENQHRVQLIEYAHIFPITDFCIMVIPEAIFHARIVKIWFSWNTWHIN